MMGIASLHPSCATTIGIDRSVIASEAKHRAACGRTDCFVAHAPLRKRFAFVAGNDGCRPSRAAGRAAEKNAIRDRAPLRYRAPTGGESIFNGNNLCIE